MGALRVIAAVGGFLLIVTVVSDAIVTLVVTQSKTRGWRPTRLWYSSTWSLARRLAGRLPGNGGESVLNVYPALSLLGLLVFWLTGLMFGWSFVYWGLHVRLSGAKDFGSIVYFAGTSLVTPTFGTAHGGLTRTFTLIETLTGLGTIAMLISYLPALYGAYSRREAKLLTLDDPLGGRITPVRVIAVHVGDGDLDLLYRFFADWEAWAAEVLESHVSYPMLALFRSQQPGQSWITALGVITDAATLTSACVIGADVREPYFLYRRGRRAIVEIAERIHSPRLATESWLNLANFDLAWAQLVELGIPLHPKAYAWRRLQELRAPYSDPLEQVINYLVAPRGFWGHSAEETVVDEVAAAALEARRRIRGARDTSVSD
jgi:hypothetical protein